MLMQVRFGWRYTSKYSWLCIQNIRRTSVAAKQNEDIGCTVQYGIRVYGSECSGTGCHMVKQTIGELGFKTPRPITIYEDNKAAILFSDHPGDHRRSKHIDIRKYFIREAVINGERNQAGIHTYAWSTGGWTYQGAGAGSSCQMSSRAPKQLSHAGNLRV